MITRRKTRKIRVGTAAIGGSAPISIQSMTKTDTRDVPATVKQIRQLENAGCDIIRAAVPDAEAARAIREIKKKIKIPLVADIHFNYKLAIEAINAGADKIRLNPGNIRKKEDIEQVVKLAKKRKIPIRIGVNSGSIGNVILSGAKDLKDPSALRLRSGPQDDNVGMHSLAMVNAAVDYIKIFEELDFYDIIISLKASSVAATIDAYREMAKSCDYPFHLGVTAAGASQCGIIKSSVGIGALLAEGIGDTIRVSLTGEPVQEVGVAQEILSSLGLRNKGIDIISCPTCGRCEVDLVKVVRELEKKLHTDNYPSGPVMLSRGPRDDRHLKVAVMGCIVNGPGEAKDADIGIAAGKNCGILFKKGKIVKKISEKDFVKTLLQELQNLEHRT